MRKTGFICKFGSWQKHQKRTLDSIDLIKSIKKEHSATLIDHQKENNETSMFDKHLKGLLSVPPPKKDK